MIKSIYNNYLPVRKGSLFSLALFVFCIFTPSPLQAHQQPTTIILLDVMPDKVGMELEIPLSELELAFGHKVTENPEVAIERWEAELKRYLVTHIQPASEDTQPWGLEIRNIKIEQTEQAQGGTFQEIRVNLHLLPPAGASTRRFTLKYDVIMHEVVTHRALVSLRSDWEAGNVGEKEAIEAGVIMVDTETSQIYPLQINLEEGGSWKGFTGMIGLGMQHIREGTDHLLFLLVLLLPATLRVNGGQWGNFGGTRYSFARLLKIVTAFTIGHSATLLVGSLGWLQLPPQPVEVLIAVSILISAVHAVRPVFPGKEMYVAAGFGLVHGLAFATVLSDLKLGVREMALSILGFNIGIELMQLFVVALVVPWLILLSLTPFYKWFRIAGALFAAVAAVAWVAERVSNSPNAISDLLQNVPERAHLGILGLALIALLAFGWQLNKNKRLDLKTEHCE